MQVGFERMEKLKIGGIWAGEGQERACKEQGTCRLFIEKVEMDERGREAWKLSGWSFS